MNKVHTSNDVALYCDFTFENASFSLFLDSTFLDNVILEESEYVTRNIFHNHPHNEIITITSGEMTFNSDKKNITVKSGQSVYCPASIFHSTKNIGAETTRLSIKFFLKQAKAGQRGKSFAFFSKIFSLDKPVLIEDSHEIIKNLQIIKSNISASDPLSMFQIQTLLQGTLLLVCKKLNKNINPNNNANFFHGNITHLLNQKVNSINMNLKDIAKELFLSERQISRHMQSFYKMTFIQRRTILRIETAKKLLTETDLPIDAIINKIGYVGKANFYKKFFESTGMTPTEFRNNKVP